ncbi:hypothetical protein OCU04_011371 [Sclerotinia nivalis]|uniref:Uncharacterized protein n=1 Tax=Sclerotinia nivalis TaxID=352851 RepID=A0A9X0ABK6_9HELO|nr:hypothetical protein OCU04_011371 [Sclerotinia nivalis]
MYSRTSISAFSLLASLIASINAYPTQLHPAPSSSETLSILNQPQTPLNLYTTTSLHPSHSGILNVHPPTSHNPSFSSSSSPLPIPFTLTSTCPQLYQAWPNLTNNLFSNLHLLYPAGPTSSPYYTFSPGRASGPSSSSASSPDQDQDQDTYTLPTTITQKSTSFKTSLYISITPATKAGVSGITKEEWRMFLRMLGLVNAGVSEEMKGMGWGRLEIGGGVPRVEVGVNSLGRRRKAEMERRRLGPSDIIFPSSTSYDHESTTYPSESGGTPSYPEEGKEKETQTQTQNQNQNKRKEISFTYTATWINYGITVDETGKEILRECSQIPLSAEIEDRKSNYEGKKKSEMNHKKGSEDEDENADEGDRWKIDL